MTPSNQYRETCGDVFTQEKVKSGSQKFTGVSFRERERILAEHREIRDILELRADRAAQGEQTAQSKLSEAGRLVSEMQEVLKIRNANLCH